MSEAIAVRKDFAGEQTTALVETSSTAVAAQAKASVEARYTMALHRPRDMFQVRERLLNECKRPGFAHVARYSKPVGGQRIEGPSVRFAEAALRCLGNVLPETSVVYDDAEKRILRVAVTDLEANLTYSEDVTIEKTVERRRVKEGQEIVRQRRNSSGDITYIVRATEDDLLNKQNALKSKALRTLALRILPGDLLDEAMEQVQRTQRDADARDPAAARKSLVDAFSRIGVSTTQLAAYLGHPVDAITLDEMQELRALGAAMKDNETTWGAAMEAKHGKAEQPSTRGVQALKEKIAKKHAEPQTVEVEPEPGTNG